MLNKEKYAKEIVEAVVNSGGQGVGVKDGKPFQCCDMDCNSCDLNNIGCGKGFTCWANSEYGEPIVDWSKVPVDTMILVRNKTDDPWERMHFAGYDGGKILTWHGGTTSWSGIVFARIRWNYAKLAESEGD